MQGIVYMCIQVYIKSKLDNTHKDDCVMLHECSTPRGGCERGMCPSRAEYKAKINKMSDLDSYFYHYGKMYIVYMNGGYSQ